MTVEALQNALKDQPAGAHVVVALLPIGNGIFVHPEGIKVEIYNVAMDAHGVLNVITTNNAEKVCASLRTKGEALPSGRGSS